MCIFWVFYGGEGRINGQINVIGSESDHLQTTNRASRPKVTQGQSESAALRWNKSPTQEIMHHLLPVCFPASSPRGLQR
jgi:hypothetical protein